MRKPRIDLPAAAIACAVLAWAPGAAARTLCSPAERVVFSCEVGRKLLSLCATRDLDDTRGSLQYRFGTPERIELSHPAKPDHPSRHFTSDRLWSRHYGSLIFDLAFMRGTTGYSVFRHELRGEVSAGVSVNVAGKVTELACKDTKGTEDFMPIVESLRLPSAN